jgi:hypothetical protein
MISNKANVDVSEGRSETGMGGTCTWKADVDGRSNGRKTFIVEKSVVIDGYPLFEHSRVEERDSARIRLARGGHGEDGVGCAGSGLNPNIFRAKDG